MDRGAWRTTVHGVAESDTAEQLTLQGFSDDSVGKKYACNAGDTGDTGSIPGSGRSPGGGNGNLLQYSCLENPMDRGAWRATVHGVLKSQTRLSNYTSTFKQEADF